VGDAAWGGRERSQAQRISLVGRVLFLFDARLLSLCMFPSRFFPGVCNLPPDQCGDLARSRLFSLNGVSAGWYKWRCWISLVPLSTRNQKEREERDRKEGKGFGVFLRSLVLPAAYSSSTQPTQRPGRAHEHLGFREAQEAGPCTPNLSSPERCITVQ
jgi:hypothetical protein